MTAPLRINPTLLACRDCDAATTWTKRVLPTDWVVVNDDPPYVLCGPCQRVVMRAALGRVPSPARPE